MKKLLLMLSLFLILGMTASAQVKHYKSVTHRACVDQDCSNWELSNVQMTWDYSKNHITIYSKELQVIDYKYLRTETDIDYVTYVMSGTDRYYNSITLFFIVFADGDLFLSIHYPDFYYTYKIVKV